MYVVVFLKHDLLIYEVSELQGFFICFHSVTTVTILAVAEPFFQCNLMKI